MSGYFRAYSKNVRRATAELGDRELRVYLALLSFANCEAMCWPGIKTLVDATNLCTDAVLTALEGLETQKYVVCVRKATRDALTHSMLPNVYRVIGAVVDDDCADDEYRTDDPILELSSNEESQHHHRTDSITQPKATQPRTPPPTRPDSSEVGRGKPTQQRGAQTPARSANTNSGNHVPRKFYSGSLNEFASPLAADDEKLVADLRAIDPRLTIRTARYLVASRGAERALWAIGHYRKQTNVYNPAGYIRMLIERDAVEQVDAAPVDPGRDLIDSWAEYVVG